MSIRILFVGIVLFIGLGNMSCEAIFRNSRHLWHAFYMGCGIGLLGCIMICGAWGLIYVIADSYYKYRDAERRRQEVSR